MLSKNTIIVIWNELNGITNNKKKRIENKKECPDTHTLFIHYLSIKYTKIFYFIKHS